MSKVFSIIFISFFSLFMISCDAFITTAFIPTEEVTTTSAIVTTASPSETIVTINGGDTSIEIGHSKYLVATVENPQFSPVITWTVDDTTIISIDQAGLIIGLKGGSCVVTATVDGNVTDTIIVTVTETVEYISDRTVEVIEEESCYRVFFSLKNEDYVRISANVTVQIIIVDDNQNIIYENYNISITEANFGIWTSATYGERYLATIEIPFSAISGATTSTGILSLKVLLDDGYYFDYFDMSIYSIPYTIAYYDVGDYVFYEIESNDSFSLADNIFVNGTTIYAENTQYDSDYYAVYLYAGETITFIMAPEYSADVSYYLSGLLDSADNVLAVGTPSYSTNTISFSYTVYTSGTYYILVLYDTDSPYTDGDEYSAYVYWE